MCSYRIDAMLIYNLTEIFCDGLNPPLNGQVSTDTLRHGGTAVYTCNLGYNLDGADTRVCEGEGTWSESAPICRSKSPNSIKMSILSNDIIE